MFPAAEWWNVHRTVPRDACGLPAPPGPQPVWWGLLSGSELWAKIIFGWMKLDFWPLLHLALLTSTTGWRQNATLFLCKCLAFKNVTYPHLTRANSLVLPLVRRGMMHLFDDLCYIVVNGGVNSPHWTPPAGAEPPARIWESQSWGGNLHLLFLHLELFVKKKIKLW